MRMTALVAFPLMFAACNPGGTSVNVDQNSTQSQNEPELDCNVQCNQFEDGRVQVIKDCQGGAPSVVIVQALPAQCDSVNEITAVSEVASSGGFTGQTVGR